MDAELLDAVAKAVHEAKMELCYGSWHPVHRQGWSRPNANSPRQPWHDIAYAQAKAAIAVMAEFTGEASEGRGRA